MSVSEERTAVNEITRTWPWMLSLALNVAVASNAHALLTIPETGYGIYAATTASGNVVSCGGAILTDEDFTVRLQSGSDGSDIWVYHLDGSAPDAGSESD